MIRAADVEHAALRAANDPPKYRPLEFMQVARRVENARERYPEVERQRLSLIQALHHYPLHRDVLNVTVNAHYLLGHSDGWDECARAYKAKFTAMQERARRFEWGHVLITALLMIFGAIGWLT